MKKVFVCVFCLVCSWGAGFAHSPSELSLSYDAEKKILTVDFSHRVRNPNDHFVDRVTIDLNKEQIIEQKLMIQESEEGGSFVYKINGLKTGDELTVTINCNKIGRKKEILVIE